MTSSLKGAATYSGTLPSAGPNPGLLQFGTKATTINKFGGRLAINDMHAASAACGYTPTSSTSCAKFFNSAGNAIIPYNTNTHTFLPLDVRLSAPVTTAFSVDATLFSTTVITVNSFPFNLTTAYQYTTSVAAGTGRRGLGQSSALTYGARMLDTLALCPAGAGTFVDSKQKPVSTSFSVSYNLPTTGVFPVAALRSFQPLLAYPVSSPFSPVQIQKDSSQHLIAACLSNGQVLSKQAGGAVTLQTGLVASYPTPSCNTNCVIAIILGVLVPLVIASLCVYHCIFNLKCLGSLCSNFCILPCLPAHQAAAIQQIATTTGSWDRAAEKLPAPSIYSPTAFRGPAANAGAEPAPITTSRSGSPLARSSPMASGRYSPMISGRGDEEVAAIIKVLPHPAFRV